MKKAIFIALIFIAGIYILYTFRKKTTTANAVKDGTGFENLVPVNADTPQNATPLFTDSGAGAIAIATRMEQLKNGGEYTRQANLLPSGVIFSGLKNPGVFQTTIGGLSLIGFPLLDRSLNAVNDAVSANASGDRNQAKAAIQRANLSFIENGLPAFLPERFKGGGDKDFYKDFICKNYGDCPGNYDLQKNNSRFPDAAREMMIDVNKLASNLIQVNNELNMKVREKAISDLIASGWKFVGYTA